MNPILTYWIAIGAVGFMAAVGSSIKGWSWYQGMRKHFPTQAAGYWPETVRDQLLVVGLACNALTGVLAAFGPIRSGIGLIAVLGGATCLSAFAIFNFVLRMGR